MPATAPHPRVSLPRSWPDRVRSAVLHATSLAPIRGRGGPRRRPDTGEGGTSRMGDCQVVGDGRRLSPT